MVNANADAMGIIFPNIYDKYVPELVSERLMASIPFASRYRLVDFLLSSMVNCGIDNIAILVRQNYFSLLDHLGSGREWDLARKKGGLNIFPPYAQKTIGMYGGRVEGLASILPFLKSQKEKYVVISDTNIAVNFDFNALIEAHIASGADVTMTYRKEVLPKSLVEVDDDTTRDLYYTLEVNGDRVEKININSQESGEQNFSMNIYVMEREWLIDKVHKAFVSGGVYFERDILIPQIDELDIRGFEFTGYAARITDMKSYFDENMKLLQDENLEALFAGHPIYTKIRDDNPTRYVGEANADNVMVADGCVIEGEIENSILFRGVKIGKGAKVKNCILMQDTVVEDGASLEYVITDKRVAVSEGKELKGTDTFPVYIAKHQAV
ncbi:glucose-1-phosphate adenylyltransferase subunit GlgD [Bariatricus sp. SGI.154]|uniref:glucose-1-phosphate adenylyltransferase subunit GlgD n=1 Tax=Bariatricus sp. SGI.154 TaxID=3420549 RepID=UPI003D05BE2D